MGDKIELRVGSYLFLGEGFEGIFCLGFGGFRFVYQYEQ